MSDYITVNSTMYIHRDYTGCAVVAYMVRDSESPENQWPVEFDKCGFIAILQPHQIFNMDRIKFNIQMQKYLDYTDGAFEIRILAWYKDHTSALKDFEHYVKTMQPIAFNSVRRGKQVIDTSTGKVYETATAAAAAYGIARSSMSNHLNRRPGYSTLYNKVFAWI